MTLIKRIAVSLLSCLVVATATAQSDDPSSPALFTLNKKPVASAEFIYLYRKNHQHKPGEFAKKDIENYLELFINYKLKVEEALTRGMDTTSAFRNEYETYRKELLKPYLPDSKMIDSLVTLTYERLTEEVNASHILIRVAPDASPEDTLAAYNKMADLRRRALAGEDFGALAARYSEEPGVETTRGNLGFFTAMQMVFPFEQAAYTTPVGGVSKPVRTRFGYHIVKVFDRQPSRGEVEVSHIMIRTTGAQDDEARNTIFDIYDKLQKGMDWEALCQRYSEDANTKDKGGKLRPFGVGGMSAAPAFQEMAFALREPGEISDPVQTPYGWHILRLESKIPLPSLQTLKPSLTQRVSRDERAEISREALRSKMRSEFNYSENESVKNRLFSMADTVLTGKTLPDDVLHEVLFTMQNEPYRVSGFIDYVAKQPEKPLSTSAQDYLEHLYVQYGDEQQLYLMERKVKQSSPEYRWLLREYYEGILLFEIMEKEIWNKAMEDSVGQVRYFEGHVKDYQAGERIVGTIYSAASAASLPRLKELLESADTAADDFLVRERIKADSGAFERDDRPVLAGVEWTPGLHLTENKGIHYLVHVNKILPPGPETFEEARASVISDYQTFLEDSWIRELKRKFDVKVNKRVKKRAFSELMGGLTE